MSIGLPSRGICAVEARELLIKDSTSSTAVNKTNGEPASPPSFVTAVQRGSDRCRHRILRDNGHSFSHLPHGAGTDGLAAKNRAVARRRRPRPVAGGRCLLRLGLWHQTRRYPGLGHRKLCGATAFNLDPYCIRCRPGRLAHRSCLHPDHRGRRAGRKGFVICASAPGRTGRGMMRIFKYGLDSPQLPSLLFSAVAAFTYLFMVARPPSAQRRQ